MTTMPVVALDDRHVLADLAQAAERDDPRGSGPSRASVRSRSPPWRRATEARPALLGAIGKTPVVRLERLAGPDARRGLGEARVRQPDRLVQGPDGAGDDRGRRALGPPAPGQTVVEYTGGSTGSSLAFVCARQGLPAPDRHLGRVRAGEAPDDARRSAPSSSVIPSPDGHHARPDPADDGARRRDRRRRRRLRRPTSSATRT